LNIFGRHSQEFFQSQNSGFCVAHFSYVALYHRLEPRELFPFKVHLINSHWDSLLKGLLKQNQVSSMFIRKWSMLTSQFSSIFTFVLFIFSFSNFNCLFWISLKDNDSLSLFSPFYKISCHILITFIQLLTLTKIYYLIKACCGSHRPWKKPCPAQLRSFQKKNGSFLDFSRNYLILYIQKNTSIVPLVTFIQNLKMFTYIHWSYCHTQFINICSCTTLVCLAVQFLTRLEKHFCKDL